MRRLVDLLYRLWTIPAMYGWTFLGMYAYEYTNCPASVHVKGGLPGCNLPQSETKKIM